MASLLRRSAA
uniref:Uncharacterized protein n=1 Tax=Setaria italica TaxID=4555 RepID=A0A341JZ24_SETIT